MSASLARRAAALLGCTEGQAYTVVIGAVLAVTLAVTGLPDAVDSRGPTQPASFAAPSRSGPAPAGEAAPTTPTSLVAEAPELPPAPGPFREPAFITEGSGPGEAALPTSPPPSQPSIVDAGWAYASSGLPIDEVDLAFVPAGGLPVAARAGSTNKVSYLRVGGESPTITLELVADPGANRLETAATIWVCPTVTVDWSGQDRQALEDAPPFECSGPMGSVKRLDDASWEIDLSAIPLRNGHRDFALAPAQGDGAAAEFQLVFERTLQG